MSEPDNPRWLDEIGGELRRDVPVRAAWRTQLLDDVARSPQPSVDSNADDPSDGATGDTLGRRARRRIVLTPVVGIAAAVAFMLLGGGVTYAVLSRAPVADRLAAAGRPSLTPVEPTSASSGREVVRFELSAPQASRVALVGSFNDWNPRSTPLVRDASTGKWMVSVQLTPGRHVYAFVVDGDVTADPAAPRAADDDFGSKNSVVFVSSPST